MADERQGGWTLETAMTYLEQQIVHERQQREAASEDVANNLRLQSTEILRRLDELNHAHINAMENWRTSLPRELFDQWRNEYSTWKDVVNVSVRQLSNLDAHVARLDARIGMIEKMANKVTGAIILLGAMGVAGVVSLILGIARISGVTK